MCTDKSEIVALITWIIKGLMLNISANLSTKNNFTQTPPERIKRLMRLLFALKILIFFIYLRKT